MSDTLPVEERGTAKRKKAVSLAHADFHAKSREKEEKKKRD
jgi:hypothetical protein